MLKEFEHLLSYADTIIVLGGIVTWTILKLREKFLGRKKSVGLDYNAAIDAKIYKLLWPMLVDLKAARIFIFQFHNGANYYTGQSIQRKTMSHEIVADTSKVQSIKSYFDNVLLSELMRDIIDILIHDQLFGLDDKDVSNEKLSPRLFKVLQSQADVYEFKSVYYFRIVNKQGHTVAILGFHWKHINPLVDRDKYRIIEYKKKIESIFNNLN